MGAINIYNKLKERINNDYGVCGLMGNLRAESFLRANNLQNTYSKKFNMSDEEYTIAVDNNTYTNFINDKAGYGLAQWTYWSRKEKLLKYAKSYGCSIGDEDLQVDFLVYELQTSYSTIFNKLKIVNSIKEASDLVLLNYEKPANQSESVKEQRETYGKEIYEQLVGSKIEKVDNMKSELIDCTVLSPNHSGKRIHSIDRITPHCVVGQSTAENIGKYFDNYNINASCNYAIGLDGKVCLVVEEENRSWCSSSNANDQRALTIECASDNFYPYKFNDECYNKLILLCVDICKRYNKDKLVWIDDKDKALSYEPKDNEILITVHRWFVNKSCPGDWLYNKLGDLADVVTSKLSGEEKPKDNVLYKVQVGAYKIRSNAYKKLEQLNDKGFGGFIVEYKEEE